MTSSRTVTIGDRILKLHDSIVPDKELAAFLECNGSLSERARGDRTGSNRNKTVSTHASGRVYKAFGGAYILFANQCAEKILALEDELRISRASSLVRSETDAKALKDLESEMIVRSESVAKAQKDLESECEASKELARITAGRLQTALNEMDELTALLDRERLVTEELTERLTRSEMEVDIQVATCNDLVEKLGVSQQEAENSEKKRVEVEESKFADHLVNIQNEANLQKAEKRIKKLEKTTATPTSTPSTLTAATPKRNQPPSSVNATPKICRKAYRYLGRNQQLTRARAALDEIDVLVAPKLDPKMNEAQRGTALLNLPEELLNSLCVHYSNLLKVMERNWPTHPFCKAVKRLQGNQRVMSVWQSVSVAVNLDMSQNQVRNLKKALHDIGAVDPFPSDRQMGYLRDILDIGRKLVGTMIECKGRKIPAMGLAPKKIRSVLSSLCTDLFEKGTLKGEKVRILNIGDGGGGVCKLGFSFADVENPLSQSNLLPYLVYQGSDEWDELRTVSKTWARALNSIKTLTFDVNGISQTVSVEWFAGGDCKYLAAIYGLKNASAKEPCPFCYTDKAGKLLANRFVPARVRTLAHLKMAIPRTQKLTTAPPRTLRSYFYDAKYGNMSVKGKPLFHIKVENCVPPGLHAIQGAFDTLIEVIARRMITNEYLIDKGLSPLKKSLDKTIGAVLKRVQAKAKKLKEKETELSEKMLLIELLESKLKDPSLFPTEKPNTNPSYWCGPRCMISNKVNFLKVSKESKGKVLCRQCLNSKRTLSGINVHFLCAGIFTHEERERAREQAKTDFTCKECDHGGIPIATTLNSLRVDVPKLEKKIQALKKKIDKKKEYLRVLKELKADDGGEPARRLEAAVKEAGGDRQAWFQRYTGNHVRKVLRSRPPTERSGPEIICSIFDDVKSPLAPVLLQALTLLGEMQAASVARDLTEEQIKKFKRDKDQFFRCLFTLEPNCSMRLKLHLLDRHVYPFMLKHGTWGRFLEQAIESKHAKWNKKARVYCSSKKQLFVQWKTIMSDMYIELLHHINPNRDYTELMAEYKRVKAAKGKWSDEHGERAVKRVDLPEESDEDEDIDDLIETPIIDDVEAGSLLATNDAESSGESMEVD